MLKEKILSILMNDNITRDEIIEELKKMIIEKEEHEKNINIVFDDMNNNKLCCMPSFCIDNCKDIECDTKIEVNT